MGKVKVSKKDILRVITQADEKTHWNTSSWKARERLLAATVGGTETSRELLDYCAIPNCGCSGDTSHA